MNFRSFTVLPSAPDKLRPLMEIAYNMWFSWNFEAAKLFKRLDPQLWKRSSQNPVRLMCLISQEKLEQAAEDDGFLAQMEQVYSRFQTYQEKSTWYERNFGDNSPQKVAYFSCEYGMHESLPIYSGGLGVLSGDHLKSSSDLGIPLVGVGLMYRQGYFRQYLNAEGMQQERYPENDWYSLPVKLVKQNGKPLLLSMEMADDIVWYQIWRVAVGRNELLLLDTNLDNNNEYNRNITTRLYDSDREVRIRQEILLGIGGIRALKALKYRPTVVHSNEGHSAFLMLERIRDLMEDKGLSYETARQFNWATTVFTTHTPVAAGNENFDVHLIEKYFKDFSLKLGLPWKAFMSLGRQDPDNKDENFSMTVLALKLSAFANGVSKLHGSVSREMWKVIFPGIPQEEIPIDHITNGIHVRSWLSPHHANLMLRYLGPSFLDEAYEMESLKRIDKIPSEEIWAVHEMRRKQLVEFARNHVRNCIINRGGSPHELGRVGDLLDPTILTIGFARRFAIYKRATLFLRNPERLKRLLENKEHPVQFLFAGKAHPADMAGKELIKKIIDFAQQHGFQNKMVFLEDYDINVARHLVQGVDVWLNTPRRPLEASGTSGMKAAVNGCLNLSVLDGWWDEAFSPETGWIIGHGEEYSNQNYQDELEASLLYHAIEKDIAPLFYKRDDFGVPRGWVEKMKASISLLGSSYNTHRMLMDYQKKYYAKASKLYAVLSENGYAEAKSLAKWCKKLAREWEQIKILKVESNVKEVMYAGSELIVEAAVQTGPMKPENLIVEVYHGSLNNHGQIEHGFREKMETVGHAGSATYFKAIIPCQRGGRYGYSVRILPGNANLAIPFLPGLMKWMEF